MMVLVTYDVRTKNDQGKRRLRRVAKVCEDYGQRVQFSVFECLLPSELWVTVKEKLANIIDPNTDSLRFYYLGKTGKFVWNITAQNRRMTLKVH